MGIHAMIVYFCFELIDLINGYRNVYSSNNVCLEFFEIVFKENMHYTCIACINTNSVKNFDKKIICMFTQKSVNIG